MPGEGLSDRLVQEMVKFGGGSLMFWGCMFWEEPGYATKIDGRMDADLFVSILDDELQESIQYYKKKPSDVPYSRTITLNTRARRQKWLQDSGLEVMVWPPQSADLYPIEHFWHHLKTRLGDYERPPSGIAELWERVQKKWEAIPASVCQNLI